MKVLSLLLGAVLTIAACGSSDAGPTVLSAVFIDGDSTVGLNGTMQLSATAYANRPLTTGVTFVWTSSDTTKVRVSQTGLVTGVKLGSATIAVSAALQAGAPVTSDPHLIRARIARIVFRPFDLSLAAPHDTVILVADVRDALGDSVPGIPVTWVSRNPGIVTVADSGTHKAIVAAVAYGTTRIVATVDWVSDSLVATVEQPLANVTLSKTGSCRGRCRIEVGVPTREIQHE